MQGDTEAQPPGLVALLSQMGRFIFYVKKESCTIRKRSWDEPWRGSRAHQDHNNEIDVQRRGGVRCIKSLGPSGNNKLCDCRSWEKSPANTEVHGWGKRGKLGLRSGEKCPRESPTERLWHEYEDFRKQENVFMVWRAARHEKNKSQRNKWTQGQKD